MNIGFDAKRLYSNFTGLGNYSRTLVKNLGLFFPENNYHLYTPKITQHVETDFFSNSPQFKTHLADTSFKSYWRSFGVTKQLKHHQIELFHGLSHELPFNIKQSKVKSIVTIHDLIFKVYPNTYSFFDRKMYDLKFKKSCENADRIIAISQNTKKDIVDFYNIDPLKIDVIYQSCQPIFFNTVDEVAATDLLKQFNLPSDFLLFVGSIERRKNLELIIQAYEYLAPNHQLPLVIIGNGKAYKTEMLKLIEQKKLSSNIIWLHKLSSNQHLQYIYHKASALIYPSLYEGFGLPVAEALLCKTPVITSAVSCLPEAGGSHSLYINPHQPKELAHAIEQVLTQPSLVETMKTEGYRYASQTFSAKTVTNQLMECYKKTI